MNAINLLIKKYIVVNKKQYFKVSFAYFLCFVLIILQIFFALGYVNESKENTLETYGSQDGILVNCLKPLNSDAVNSCGNFYIFGNCQNEEYSYNNTLTIGYADEQAFDINHLTLVEGNLPVRDTEILIEESVNSVLRSTLKVGDKINLNINFFNDDNSSSVKSTEFIVSGIIKNYSKTQWNQNSDSGLPNILVSKQYFNSNGQKYVNIKSVILDSHINTNSFFNDLLIKDGLCSEYFVNEHSSAPVEKSLAYICIGIIVLTTLFSFSILFTIHSLLKNSDQNKTGLLQSVGMDNTEIYKYFLFSRLIYIATGLAATIIVAPFLLYITKLKLFPETPFEIFEIIYFLIAIILLSIISLLLTYSSTKKHLKLSSIQNINVTSDGETHKQINIKVKNPALLWALKDYTANPSRFFSVSLMTIILILLSILGGVSINFVKSSINSLPSDIVVSVYDGSFSSDLRIPSDPFYGIEDADLNYIQSSKDIKNLISLSVLQINYVTDKFSNENTDLCNSQSYKEALVKYGYDENLKLKSDNLFSTNSEALEMLKKVNSIEGDIDISKLNSGQEVVICKATNQYDNFRVGDTIKFTQVLLTDDGYKKIDFQTTIGAIITFSTAENDSFLKDVFGDRIIWGDNSFSKLGIDLKSNLLYIQLNSYQEYSDLDIRLNSITDNYKDSTVSVDMFFEQLALQHSLLDIIEVIIFISSALLLTAIFVSIYVQNTIRLKEQKQIFLALRAIGMNFSNLYSIFLFENIIQYIVSIIVGGGCGIIIIVLLKYQLWLYDLISVNWQLFFLTALILLLFLVISPLIPIKQFISRTISDNQYE